MQSQVFKDNQTSVSNPKLLASLTEVHNRSDIAFMRKDILVQENSKESFKKRAHVLKTKNRKFSILAI